MNIIPGQGMQPMGVGQFGMTPQQQQQRMMFPGQQQMMTQQQIMMQQQQGMQQMPGGMRPQGQMMQTQVGMGMQPQMHGMHNQMVRQVGPRVPSQQQRFQQPGFQGQQMPRQVSSKECCTSGLSNFPRKHLQQFHLISNQYQLDNIILT